MNTEAMPTRYPWHVGAQNDILYIVSGRPPATNNDYPDHDADRTPVARVYDDKDPGGTIPYAQAMANANRMAAAPEMKVALDETFVLLAACQVAAERLEDPHLARRIAEHRLWVGDCLRRARGELPNETARVLHDSAAGKADAA